MPPWEKYAQPSSVVPANPAVARQKAEDQQFQRNADARADLNVQMEQQRLLIAQQAAELARQKAAMDASDNERKDRTSDARGGIDTTESERTAAYLATRVAGGLDDLRKIGSIGAPSLKDAMVGGTMLGNYTTDEDRQRAINAQREILDAALTLGTGAAYTREQIEAYRSTYFPQPGDKPATVQDKARRLDRLLSASKLKAGAASGLINQALSAQVQGAEPKQLSSAGKFERDPELAGANARVTALIKSGSSADEIKAYLNGIRPGLAANIGGIDEAVVAYRQNPRAELNVDVEKAWKPADPVSKTLGDIGLSPVGTAAIGAADVLSMGTLDNLTGNPQETRDVMGGVKSVNPGSYVAGQLGGGVAGALIGEGLLGAAGLSAARSGLVADALVGGGYGAGSADASGDSRVTQALMGAGLGVAGNKVGSVASALVGRGLTGVTDPARRALHEAGVRLTPGQAIGGAVGRTEDRLAGLPLVGDAINARRSEGILDFNQAGFDQALAPIGASTNGVTGAAGVDIARAARSQAYDDALNGVQVNADPAFVTDMQGVIARGQQLPDPMRSNLEYTLPTRVGNSFDQNGGLTGQDYQQALRGLRRDASSMEQLPYGYDFAQVTRGAEDALEGLVQRQSPGTVDALRAANEANRNVETLRTAVNAARNGSRSHQVDVFMPSQLADAAAASARKYGNSAGTTNQPFFELTRAGQSVLPSQVPDSGTAGRVVLPLVAGSALGGGSYASQGGEEGAGANSLATGAVVTALLAAPYSSPARKLVQEALLAQRPQAITDLGQIALGNQRIAGLLGGASAIPYAAN